MISRYTKDHKDNVYGDMPQRSALSAFKLWVIVFFMLFALFSAFSAFAATVVVDGFRGELSQTRDFDRSGPYKTQWTTIPGGANTAYHQGRTDRVFEDAGMGEISFKVKADALGKARVAFQDVGDTRNFGSFAINGETVDLPSQRSNSGWITADLDFGVGGLGWHEVKATTALRPGLSNRRQDGFGACKSRKR